MFSKLIAVVCRAMLLLASAGFAVAGVIACLRLPFPALILAGVLAWKRVRPWQGSGWAHGTARVATASDLYRHGLIGGDRGLILGRAGFAAPSSRPAALRTLISAPLGQSGAACRLFLSSFQGKRWTERSLIRLPTYVHLATFAPTGRGKGVACLLPNLMDHPGACVVTDPQATLTRKSARFRARVFGHKTVIIDPFNISGAERTDTYNVLDRIAADSPDLLDQCRELANVLVIRTGKEQEPHFNDMAEVVLTVFIAFICTSEEIPEHRNLQTVRDIVANRNRYAKALDRMKTLDACGGMLKRLAGQLSWLVDRELGSVLSTVQRHTAWMDSPAMVTTLARSSFDPGDLKCTGRMTIYLCMPPERLVTHAPLMRLWVGGLIRAVASGGVDERRTVLFMLDEAGHLGAIPALEQSVELMRAYGIRLWFFFQSIGQVTKCFGDRAGIFLDNIDTQQFFGINAIESAEAISKRAGFATILTESHQDGSSTSHPSGGGGQGQPGQYTTNRGVTVSEMGRQLFRPEEIIRFSEDLMIAFHRNLPPILGRLAKYYESPEIGRRGGLPSQRLGLGGALASALALVVSILAVTLAASLPVATVLAPPGPSGMGYPTASPGGGRPPLPYGGAAQGLASPFDEGVNGRCVYCQAPMRLGHMRNENVRCRQCGGFMGVSQARRQQSAGGDAIPFYAPASPWMR